MFKMFKKSLPSTSKRAVATRARRRGRRPSVWSGVALTLAASMLPLLIPAGASADGPTTLVSLNREGFSVFHIAINM